MVESKWKIGEGVGELDLLEQKEKIMVWLYLTLQK